MQNTVLRKFLIRTRQVIGILVIFILLFLLMLEVSYRYQWFDFYAKEFRFLNREIADKTTKPRVLVLGDSFTAFPQGYVSILNTEDSTRVYYNSGISGIGAQEICCIAPLRIKQLKPSLVLVQVYVGNDLLDVEKPINFKTLPLHRNMYWILSNNLFGVRYINYNLGQLKYTLGAKVDELNLKDSSVFSVEKISAREKLLLNADPIYYEKSVQLNSCYLNRFAIFVNELKKLNAICASQKIPLKILVIPASFQVSDYYKKNLQKCGAVFTKPNTLELDYPFIQELTKELSPIQILNPLNALQKADTCGHRVYFENDLHLNKTGNRVLAYFLEDALK